MNTPQRKIMLLAGVLAITSTVKENAIAQETSSSVISNEMTYETSKPQWQRVVTPDSITHFSQFAGPSLSLDSNPNSYDGSEDTGGQSSWHQVSLQYKMDNGYKFVFNPRFIMEFGPEQEGVQRNRLDNPVVGIQGTWYKNGNFSFSGGLNTVAYVFDEGDREDGLLYNPGGFQSLNYKMNNQVDVGSWFWARYRYFENNAERSRAPMFFAPYVSYTVNDKLSFTSFYQYNGAFAEVDQVDLDPDDSFNFLTSYTLNKYLTVQPIITLYRETEMNINSGNLNVWLSGRFY